ncbi:MAG: sensor histidine kinase [Sarcina sp.]
MRKNKDRGVSLYKIFAYYLVVIFTSTILLGIGIFLVILLSIKSGFLLPANYAENAVSSIKLDLAKDGLGGAYKIPYFCKYAFYNREGIYVQGNINEEEKKIFENCLHGKSNSSKDFIQKINSKDGTYVIGYSIKARYKNKKLNEILPTPEIIISILFIGSFLVLVLLISILFARKLKRELEPLKYSTEKIKAEQLDFEVSNSNIKEFNEILISINDMKTALKTSLENQWREEENRREQIAALAHDIKTPLTIIKGSSELLEECEIDEEGKELIEYILRNSNKIENYIEILIQTSKSEKELVAKKENINIVEFIEFIKQNLVIVAKRKSIKLVIDIKDEKVDFLGDRELLERAINNLIENAVSYSPENSKIILVVEKMILKQEEFLAIIIEDFGKGFSKEALVKGKNKFFMENKERKVGKNYGLGLYIVESIAKLHGGYLKVDNKDIGAKVTLLINFRI